MLPLHDVTGASPLATHRSTDNRAMARNTADGGRLAPRQGCQTADMPHFATYPHLTFQAGTPCNGTECGCLTPHGEPRELCARELPWLMAREQQRRLHRSGMSVAAPSSVASPTRGPPRCCCMRPFQFGSIYNTAAASHPGAVGLSQGKSQENASAPRSPPPLGTPAPVRPIRYGTLALRARQCAFSLPPQLRKEIGPFPSCSLFKLSSAWHYLPYIVRADRLEAFVCRKYSCPEIT